MSQTDQIRVIVDDLYGKGHGEEMTVQRIQDVFQLPREAALIAFNQAKRDIEVEQQSWIQRGLSR